MSGQKFGIGRTIVLNFLSGYKTYIAAFGLLGYAIQKLTEGDITEAFRAAAEALAVFGLRVAISKQ